MYPDLKLFIGGEWRKTASDLPVVNPATEEEIGRLPRAGINDLDDALDAAENGLRIWRRTAPRGQVRYHYARCWTNARPARRDCPNDYRRTW